MAADDDDDDDDDDDAAAAAATADFLVGTAFCLPATADALSAVGADEGFPSSRSACFDVAFAARESSLGEAAGSAACFFFAGVATGF